MSEKSMIVKSDSIINKPLEDVMHDSMIPYAEYVILDRAIPRVEDGLKPVQRRILYTMYDLGVTPDKPYKKSARIVGECLGKYHPHGDTSVYDAMVRMAQSFNMSVPLVDGHGNFGSVDGDGAAAMRYTEVRLAPLALELLRDLDKDTVKWSLNFDDTTKEPDMLPVKFPNLLVNGSYGIAVGLATNIPPHNLAEVVDGVIAYIDNPDITLKSMMKIIKGPDFPTGGYIITGEELEKAYETGKGKITIRAKASIESGDGDRKNIVITEMPFQVNKALLLQKILQLKEDKKDLLAGIYDICDESDRNGMRAVIKVKKDADPNQILNVLFKSTDLETSFGINMVAIADGKPQLMGLLDIIYYYINYHREVIIRRTRFLLNEAKEREHILKGLVIAVRNIDEVVKIIKTSANVTEARKRLCERFDLSERQANAILDMRLARLTNLEIFKLEEELKEVQARIKEYEGILASKKRQLDIVKSEMLEVKKQYRAGRRSTVVRSAEDTDIPEVSDEIPVAETVVAVNANELLKRVPPKNFSLSSKEITDKSTLSEIAEFTVNTMTDKKLLLFTNLGNCHKVDVSALPECKWREKGTLLKNLAPNAQPHEHVVALYPIGEEFPKGHLLMFTKTGYVKKTAWEEYDVSRASFQAIKLKDGDEVLSVEEDLEGSNLIFLTKGGRCLHAEKGDLPVQGRVAGGVHGVNLSDGDETVFAGQVEKKSYLFAVTENGYFKKVAVKEIDPMARYRKGVRFLELGKENGKSIVFGLAGVKEADLAVLGEEQNIVGVSTSDFTFEARGGKGKTLKQFKKGGLKVKAVFRHLT